MSRAANFRAYLAHQLVEQHGAEPDLAPTVAGILANAVTWDEDGVLVISDRFGMPTTAGIEDLVAEFRATPGGAAFFVKAADTKPADTRPRVLVTVAGAIPSKDRSTADRVADAVAGGNPWARDSLNVTRQQLVAGLDPDRAAKLQMEAGR